MINIEEVNKNQTGSAEWLHRNFHDGKMEDCVHLPCRMAIAIKTRPAKPAHEEENRNTKDNDLA